MAAASHYAKLKVWQKAMRLAEDVYGLCRSFPACEQFGLSSQLRRAAVSVPSNIAEGNARGSLREYIRFVSIARGSLAEIETQLLLAERIGLGERELLEQCREEAAEIGRMLQGLHSALQCKLQVSRPR